MPLVKENAFEFFDSYGLPLVIQMDLLEKYGGVVALDLFIRDAVRAGWTFKKAITVSSEALCEKYGTVVGMQKSDQLEEGMKTYWTRYWPELNTSHKEEY